MIMTLSLGLVPSDLSYAVLGNVSPKPSDMQDRPSGGAGHGGGSVDHLIKKETTAHVEVKLGAYYNTDNLTNPSNGNKRQITIKTGKDGKKCLITGNPAGDVRVTIRANSSTRNYDIPANQLCNSGFYGQTFDFPTGGTLIDDTANSGKYYAEVYIRFRAGVPTGASNTRSANFVVELDGYGSSSGILAAQASEPPSGNNITNDFQTFGMRSTWFQSSSPHAHNHGFEATMQFGAPCNWTPQAMMHVYVYDLDSVFGNQYVWIEKDGVKLNRGDYHINGIGRAGGVWDASNKRWRLNSSNNNWNTIRFKADPGEKYNLVYLQPHYQGGGSAFDPSSNVISAGIPVPSILSSVNCSSFYYELSPSVAIDPENFVFADTTMTVDYEVARTGAATNNHDWRVSRIIYAPNQTPQTGNFNTVANGAVCSTHAGTNDSCTADWESGTRDFGTDLIGSKNNSVGNLAFGTKICFVTSVKQPTPSETRWRYSSLECAVVAKQPNLQIHGGDLRVAGTTNSCDDPSDKGYIRSSFMRINGRSYGSWGEFGSFSQCNVYSFTTGAHFDNGQTSINDSAHRSLTFANTGVTPAPPYGRYDTGSQFVKGVAALTSCPSGPGVETHTSFSNFVGDVDEDAVTGTHCISTTGTLTITDNIVLTNTPGSIGDIPQVIIIADDIKIEEDVKRIDAWLISHGDLSTCVNTAGDRYAKLSLSRCAEQLVINGPVYLDGTLYAHRTFGASDTDDDNMAGEVFNLPASTVLWLYNEKSAVTPRFDTVGIQELPPRY